MGQFLGYIPIDSTRSTIPVYSPDGSKSTVTNTTDPVPPPSSGGSVSTVNPIDVAPTPLPGPIMLPSTDNIQTGNECITAPCPGSGSGYGNGQPASGSIGPAGFLRGKYTFKIGGKSYSVSKKVVWGTGVGIGGTLLLIAILR